jgi:hypothetical protein
MSKRHRDGKPYALSLHQPLASFMVHGIKQSEGRVWDSDFRGELWIHAASKAVDAAEIAQWEEYYRAKFAMAGLDVSFPKHYPTSALLGKVFVDDVLPQEKFAQLGVPAHRDSSSPFVFLCSKPRRLVLPFPHSGQHKIWPLPRRVAADAELGLKPATAVRSSRARAAAESAATPGTRRVGAEPPARRRTTADQPAPEPARPARRQDEVEASALAESLCAMGFPARAVRKTIASLAASGELFGAAGARGQRAADRAIESLLSRPSSG